MLGTYSGVHAETGNSVKFAVAHVYEFDDGKVVRFTTFADTALYNAATEP